MKYPCFSYFTLFTYLIFSRFCLLALRKAKYVMILYLQSLPILIDDNELYNVSETTTPHDRENYRIPLVLYVNARPEPLSTGNMLCF